MTEVEVLKCIPSCLSSQQLHTKNGYLYFYKSAMYMHTGACVAVIRNVIGISICGYGVSCCYGFVFVTFVIRLHGSGSVNAGA